jgi:DNA end-binding protein Ku
MGAERPYALLLRAMQDRSKVGIGTFVMREKEHLAAIRAMDGALVLDTMFLPDEVREIDEIANLPEDVDVDPKQLRTAVELIDSLSSAWEPDRYHDTYRERVLELIERKAEGRSVVTEEPARPGAIGDLMNALRASVEAAKKERPGATKRDSRKPAGRMKEDLARLSRDELYERAQRLGIPGRSAMNKDELIAALKKAS